MKQLMRRTGGREKMGCLMTIVTEIVTRSIQTALYSLIIFLHLLINLAMKPHLLLLAATFPCLLVQCSDKPGTDTAKSGGPTVAIKDPSGTYTCAVMPASFPRPRRTFCWATARLWSFATTGAKATDCLMICFTLMTAAACIP